MKLTGEVLKRFADSENEGKVYAPKGTADVEEYTGKRITYPHVFTAEKERYEQLEKMGYVSRGTLVGENKKSDFKMEDDKKEEE